MATPQSDSAKAASQPPAPIAVDPLAPLELQQRATLLAGPVDAPLPVDIHYVQSNETRHDLFFPFIDGVGGAFVGVGSDQSFTMAAVARAQLMVLMDIDQRVVDLHRIYAVLIPRSDSPSALVDAFSKEQRDSTLAHLETAFADQPHRVRERLLREYRASRTTVHRHLGRVLGRTVDGVSASWLSDRSQFEHIQRLYQSDRVRVMTGDLTGEASVQSAAAAVRGLGLTVRVLYMSNAEEYFTYTPQFRANVQALPTDDRSVVLRTIYAKTWPHADLWSYQVQPLADFEARVSAQRGRSRNGMLRHATRDAAVDREPGPRGLTTVAMAAP
ncbi:MAG: hypothetical protein K0V04_32920 [Deltaproteobacteria bacterium]|nr:hypothetical protein [Deltaproteobacteria bacterium]